MVRFFRLRKAFEAMLGNLYLEFGTLGIPSGGGGCAAHRPPHQKERKQIDGDEEEWFPGKSYQTKRGQRAATSKSSQYDSQVGPKSGQDDVQVDPKVGQIVQEVPESRPRDVLNATESAREANLAPTWEPKRCQNQDRNPRKWMFQSNTCSGSILKGFGRRFGRVFYRFSDHFSDTARQSKSTSPECL